VTADSTIPLDNFSISLRILASLTAFHKTSTLFPLMAESASASKSMGLSFTPETPRSVNFLRYLNNSFPRFGFDLNVFAIS
jgi:hypothetical protein